MAVEGDARARRVAAGAGSLPAKAMAEGAATGNGVMSPDEAVRLLYHSHYAELVRITALLVGDVATAEGLVEDSFIAMHRVWWRLRDSSRAVPYLRRSVMNRTRSALRHHVPGEAQVPGPAPGSPDAGEDAPAMLKGSSVLTALGTLPPRQRQVIVLRYYAHLSETQIADALGIAAGSVNSDAARALDSLQAAAGNER